jgi:DNA-binding transcriptional regulator LsrR (DeoR family)
MKPKHKTKEERVLDAVAVFSVGDQFTARQIAKKLNLCTSEIGRHLSRTNLVKYSLNVRQVGVWERIDEVRH